MSTSSQTPSTNVRFSEEQLIGATVLVVLAASLPIAIEGGLLIAAHIFIGSGIAFLASLIARVKGYTERAQARVALGGTLLSITAAIVAFATTLVTGAIFFGVASVLGLGQLFLKF